MIDIDWEEEKNKKRKREKVIKEMIRNNLNVN